MKNAIKTTVFSKKVLNTLNKKERGTNKMEKFVKMSLVCMGIISLVLTGQSFARDNQLANEYRSEMATSNQRAVAQAGIAGDIRAEEYQNAKTITDVFGKRVRMEQYVIREDLLPTQYKICVLNDRDGELTEGYSLKTFNKDLPVYLSDLYGKMSGIGAPPKYYEKDVETEITNGLDIWRHEINGGELVKRTEEIYDVFYKDEKISVGNVGSELIAKIEVKRTGLSPYNANNYVGTRAWYVPDKQGQFAKLYDEANPGFLNINFDALPKGISFFAEPGKAHWGEAYTFADGTSLSHERYWINDDGDILDWRQLAGEGLTADNWQDEIAKWNNEHVITATEFDGRNINIVWSPHSLALSVLQQDNVPGQ